MSPVTSDPSAEIIDRGQDFAVYRSITSSTNEDGQVSFSTNQFTLIENGLHYLENGVWKASEDLIEVFPGGAIARRGPTQAIFSADLNSDAVFDIGSDGVRLRGGVRAVQLTDFSTGKSQVIGTVKKSVKGQLLPPNRILWADAFDGIPADVLVVWKHNLFSHDIILRAQPHLPADWNPEAVRLEVITEFIVDAEPQLRVQTVRAANQPELEDDVVIHFGSLAMVMGKALPVADDKALALSTGNFTNEGAPVLKQWRRTEDGRRFLIESVSWADVWPHLKGLPVAQRANNTDRPQREVASVRTWPDRPKAALQSEPIQIASAAYQPKGYLVDFVIIPDQGTPTTFTTGTTYYIKTSYYYGGFVTFQPGCVIKYKNNAYMLLYGPVSFPQAGQTMPVFTSRNDNNFGEVIQGVPGEANSNGDPTLHKAVPAIWIYYTDYSNEIRNARIRWAKTGIQNDRNDWQTATLTVRDCLFEHIIGTGSIGIAGDQTYVTTINLKKCNVTNPGAYMTEDCGVVSIARVNDPAQDTASGDPNKNSQSECSFVVVDSSRIVAAFFDTHLSEYALGNIDFPGIVSPRSTGWAVSTDGGVSFTDQGALLPNPPTSTLQGDAGDPVMARDTANGTIYLLVNPSREPSTWRGFRLWKSTDNGQSFALVNTDVFGGAYTRGDKPMIAVNNFSGLSNSQHLYVAGKTFQGMLVTHSADGGVNWDAPVVLSGIGFSPDIAIRANGTVYVFYVAETFVSPPDTWQNSIQYRWLRPGHTYWDGPETVPAHPDSQLLYSVNGNASGNLKRSNSADPDDYFVSNGFPRVAVNPVNGRIYLVYADLPFAGSTTDRGDIFVQDASPTADGSLAGQWSGAIKVNKDATQTDQWNPAVTVNPAGTVLFIGYYSRQSRPTQNDLIMAYGSKANVAGGLVGATFDMIPISTTAFAPLFPGTVASTPPQNTWMYDHVWLQTDVCLDSNNATVISCPSEFYQPKTLETYQHFMADDYTWASADGSYFYYAWCDRVDTYVSGGNSRRDPNIRLGKIRQ
ncbi:MAG: sialidase family protein [Verrucomicrobiota bacterium]